MSLVRFAMVCDKCRVRQEEYAGYLTCRECGDDVCEKCCVEYDPDPPGRAVCNECAVLNDPQIKAMNAMFDMLFQAMK